MSKEQQGLYDSRFEHDNCGIGFVANLKNKKSNGIVQDALRMLERMEHRGAVGAEPNSGDGAGILLQKPHSFYVKKAKELGFELPEFDEYGVAQVFFPADDRKEACKQILEEAIAKFNFEIIGYRVLPKNNSILGFTSGSCEPEITQVFIKRPADVDVETFERQLFVIRNYTSHQVVEKVENTEDDFYIATCSYKTIAYKGQFTTEQVGQYFHDLNEPDCETAIAVVHSRFSTNTFPKWKLAQPFRYIAHNGEINTVRGNVNWFKSREAIFKSTKFTEEELDMIMPICNHSQSDSANLDNAVEMLALSGRSLPHVMMMVMPEAWQENPDMEAHKKAFYQYHANIMEPWDGPASVSFTDGKIVGATLDRNGLRPSRYLVTDDDKLIMASETGVLKTDPAKVVKRGRLQPGKIFVADLEQGRIIADDEVKEGICSEFPYEEWVKEQSYIDELPEVAVEETQLDDQKLLDLQQAFGYTAEDLKFVIAALADDGKEPLSAMGVDIPLPVLSEQTQHISCYFKQIFAQVTNPPIDPIRERMVMSLMSFIGEDFNLLEATTKAAKKIRLEQPVLTNAQLAKLKGITEEGYRSTQIDILFGKDEDLKDAVARIANEAIEAVKAGNNILILSNKGVAADKVAIPSLLATGAVHHALIKAALRAQADIVVEAGDVFETHHVATLVGYGASGVNPFLGFETIKGLQKASLVSQELAYEQLEANYIAGIGMGMLKIFSKMGISTLQSYQGAQIFEALGIDNEVIDIAFAGTASRIKGINFEGLKEEALVKHNMAFPEVATEKTNKLEVGGVYQWKRRGEFHLFNPNSISYLQRSTKNDDYTTYKKYANEINDQTKKAATLRGLLEFTNKEPISLAEVEPVEAIYKRFATGAMSFGSISHEAHSTLAIAMNRIGGKSNSGEGGEDPRRFEKKENGDWERSAIKQVASGRFGVTSYYLSNADEIQIKMAQGAKPGEGGQLPGHKVDDWIGATRHSTPGVGLISPPPHHDIYSIEDLAQLISDLKNANRAARINVKLVSEAGVGTIASGVCKAHADVVLIAGHDGGTGASPVSSIRHAGGPWELGLAETHQTLVKNRLRDRITVQADGQMKTGRDLAVATLLGAEEWGVATAALVVEGCIMMRKCHLNTCPVGIATQNKDLRARYNGKPEYVVNFFKFLASELREIMAELGFRTVDEMVGRVDKLKVRDNLSHWKQKNLDLSLILAQPEVQEGQDVIKTKEQDHALDQQIDWKFLELAKPALENQAKVEGSFEIENINRSAGTILSNEISKIYKGEGLPEDTIKINLKGSAGQSFGAFTASGLTLNLEGEANDYFGKGLSGAKLILKPHVESPYDAKENIIVGNVAFYGATSGEAYMRGIGGERFCVRNSGAKAVVEGIGDHGCEYMTGGIAVVLGETGRNFAAGMSGGVAYIYDKNNTFKANCNMEMVEFDAMDDEDKETLNYLISRHKEYTGSDVAEEILADFDGALNKFVKVMPTDYKRVLLKRKVEALENNKKEVTHG